MGAQQRRVCANFDLNELPHDSIEDLEEIENEFQESLHYARHSEDAVQSVIHPVVAKIATDTEGSGPAKIHVQGPIVIELPTEAVEVAEGADHALSPKNSKILHTIHGESVFETTLPLTEIVPAGRSKKLNIKGDRPTGGKRSTVKKSIMTPKRSVIVAERINPQMVGTFIHLHYYLETGRWGAWLRLRCSSESVRIFLGTHLTQYLAARCQDRIILMYESISIKTMELNFQREDYAEDEELRRVLTPKEFRKLLQLESHPTYSKVEATSCLRKFMLEENALQRISEKHLERANARSLKEYFERMLFENRKLKKNSPEFSDLLRRLLSNIPVLKKKNQQHRLSIVPCPSGV